MRNSRTRLWLLVLTLFTTVGWASLASAQEPVWSLRAAGGLFVPTGDGTLDPAHDIDIDSGPVITIEMTRRVDLGVEAFLGSVMAFTTRANLDGQQESSGLGALNPIGFRAGLSYRLWKEYADDKPRGNSLFLSTFVGGYVRDRSTNGSTRPLTTAGGYSIGFGGSFRHVVDQRWTVDVAATWERSRLLVDDQGQIGWNPFTVTAGLIMTLR